MFISWTQLSVNLRSKASQTLIGRQRVATITTNPIPSEVSVVYCQSTDIFANLSVEDWLYRQRVTDRPLLLMWRNQPSVVVGRHQNPWREVYLSRCVERDVRVVRRNSGGGTVYHDLNNLNISFICRKQHYNRRRNLVFIQKLLMNGFGVDSHITQREDLVLATNGHKISGTASKVGAHNSYHHLTLLIDVDMNQMKQFIRNQAPLMSSKATESIPSKTQNLKSVVNDITLEDVVNEMAIQFCKDQGRDIGSAYMEVMADENSFVGLQDIETTFKSWQWIYGKTPRFTVTKRFQWEEVWFDVEIQVYHGLIEKLTVTQFETNLDLVSIPFTIQSVANRLNQCLPQIQTNYSFEKYLCNCIIDCLQQTL